MHGTPQGSTQDRTGAHGTAQRDTQDRTEKRSNAYRASFNKPSVLASRNGFWSGSCPCERCAMGTGLGIRLRGPCPSSSVQWVLVSGVAGACPGLSRRRSLQTGVAADLSRQFVSNKDPLAGPFSDPRMGVQRPMPHCKGCWGPFSLVFGPPFLFAFGGLCVAISGMPCIFLFWHLRRRGPPLCRVERFAHLC